MDHALRNTSFAIFSFKEIVKFKQANVGTTDVVKGLD